MSDKEKIDFLLQLLREENLTECGVDKASALVQAFKWLLDQKSKLEEK